MRARQKTLVMPHAVECAQRTDGKRRQGKEEKRLVKLSSRRSIAKQPRSLTIHGKSHGECCRIKQQSRARRDGLVAVHDLTVAHGHRRRIYLASLKQRK